MPVSLSHVTFDCSDPPSLAAFWAAALDRPVDEDASAYFASIDHRESGRPSWFFIRVPEPKSGKNRLHVDLSADDRDAEVARLSALGATEVSAHDEWGTVWTVMTDPEGNVFCVGQRPVDS